MINLLYAKDKNLCFISNPVYGSSLIKHALSDGEFDQSTHSLALFDPPTDAHTPLFSIVQNPFRRIYSAYKKKIFLKDKYFWPKLSNRYGLSLQSEVSFLEFLSFLKNDENLKGVNPLFRPQYLNLHSAEIDPEFVGRSEELTHIQTYLKSKGVYMAARKPVEDYNLDLSPNLNSIEVQLIREIYQLDFEIYGYSLDYCSVSPTEPIVKEQVASTRFKQFVCTNQLGITAEELRDLAIKRENQDLNASYNLMLQAHFKRPWGEWINKKLGEYAYSLKSEYETESMENHYCHNTLKTRFVIIGQERTGSTLLQMLLQSHPNVLSLGELFNGNIEIRRKSPIRAINEGEDPILFADQHLFDTNQSSITSIGFRLFYTHAKIGSWKHIWKYIADQNLKIIHLKRKNLLDRYLSFQVAQRTKEWAKTNSKGPIKSPRVTINVQDCVRSFNETEWFYNHIESQFVNNEIYELYYEDLTSSLEFESKKIQEFLGLNFHNLSSPTRKQQKKPKREVIENYDNLKSRLTEGVQQKWAQAKWLEFFDS